jgi:hypothetical protein
MRLLQVILRFQVVVSKTVVTVESVSQTAYMKPLTVKLLLSVMESEVDKLKLIITKMFITHPYS